MSDSDSTDYAAAAAAWDARIAAEVDGAAEPAAPDTTAAAAASLAAAAAWDRRVAAEKAAGKQIIRSCVPQPVEYTYSPLPKSGPTVPPKGSSGRKKQRWADARLRRAFRDAWCDPERARKDLLAAGNAYADLRDPQGMAHAFIAHAETRLADSHHTGYGASLGLSAVLTAREEFQYAGHILTAVVNEQCTRYSTGRGEGFKASIRGQRMRHPQPLTLTAADTRVAAKGGF
jgi:hypothetical protein